MSSREGRKYLYDIAEAIGSIAQVFHRQNLRGVLYQPRAPVCSAVER